ncbi:transmembrane protein [Legionella steigerwaltii]|uniref:Transmembrane protein n=1 Tax=Legionella steigerwaltii TaxID=460 RepID=A0A378LB90_9GAMM|nr:hypothetical protein [Legionella steigerwaltii]KTD78990.1 transmembrane protein [Legionella steigerwaltii]STY23580.1 transmembrane protein [Legionella steigerwaltii]
MDQHKHYRHQQYTPQASIDTNYHGHDAPPPYNPLYPRVQVTSPYIPPVSRVEVVTPTRRVYPYRSYSTRSTSLGAGVLLLIIAPIFVVALILKLTLGAVGLTAASMTTAGVAGAGAAGVFGLSVGTLGVGALALYATLALGYLYSSAKECYSSDKNVFDMIKSRVVNEDGLSFTGVFKSIGAVLWSPFLLIGGLAGMGVKAAANASVSKSSPVKKEEPAVQLTASPYSKMSRDSSKQSDLRQEKEPYQLSSIYTESETHEKGSHLFDSQTSFPSAIYSN